PPGVPRILSPRLPGSMNGEVIFPFNELEVTHRSVSESIVLISNLYADIRYKSRIRCRVIHRKLNRHLYGCFSSLQYCKMIGLWFKLADVGKAWSEVIKMDQLGKKAKTV